MTFVSSPRTCEDAAHASCSRRTRHTARASLMSAWPTRSHLECREESSYRGKNSTSNGTVRPRTHGVLFLCFAGSLHVVPADAMNGRRSRYIWLSEGPSLLSRLPSALFPPFSHSLDLF